MKISREQFFLMSRVVLRHGVLPDLGGANALVQAQLDEVGIEVERPKTDAEKIDAFVAAVRALSGPSDETWVRCVFQLIHTHLGVEI